MRLTDAPSLLGGIDATRQSKFIRTVTPHPKYFPLPGISPGLQAAGALPVKMYVLIRESVPLGYAVLAAAHASLACYLKYQDAAEVAAWLSGPFSKVICKVSDPEFEQAKAFDDGVLLTESALGGQEVAIAFKPREEWPKAFRFYRLYR